MKVVEEHGIVDDAGNKERDKENMNNKKTVKKIVQKLVPPTTLKAYNEQISLEAVKDINQTWKSTSVLRNFGGDVSLSYLNRLRMVQQFETISDAAERTQNNKEDIEAGRKRHRNPIGNLANYEWESEECLKLC